MPGAYRPAMSDAAVEAKTGRTWAQWFSVLDRAGARKHDHKGIVAILAQRFDVGPWWQQMVTVEYERARGKREVYQTVTGFSVSVTRTIAASGLRLFDAWKHSATRKRWLGSAKLTIRSARRGRSLRITWGDGSNVEVMLIAKPGRRTQISVQHSKLRKRSAVARLRAHWKARLTALTEVMAG